MCAERETGAEEVGVVSSASNWGPAWQVLKQKKGNNLGASHITEMTNHGDRLGREESETRRGR